MTHPAARGARVDVFGLETDLFELLRDPLRTLPLALRSRRISGVGGVETNQRADEVDHFIDGACHSHSSYHWLGRSGLGLLYRIR